MAERPRACHLETAACIGSILSKGEARNELARAIFFNRLGEPRDRTFEKQQTGLPG